MKPIESLGEWVRFKDKFPKIGRFTRQKEHYSLPDSTENITYGQYMGHDLTISFMREYCENAVWKYVD